MVTLGGSRGRRAVAFVAAIGATLGCASVAPAKLASLPLTGETTSGQRWRLEAGTAGSSEKSSWCLNLRYTTDIVVDGDPFVGGTEVCGPRPVRRVSGQVVVDCARDAVFVFGGARSMVKAVTLHMRRGPVLHASRARLPAGSGFRGHTFMLVADARRLPARVEASGAGQRQLLRLPARRELCAPGPGAPDGGEPFADFQSRR